MTTTELAPEEHAEENRPNPFVRVYRGETKFDFVGRRRWWFAASGLIIVLGLVSFGARGFNWGIDFKSGTSWEVPAHGATFSDVRLPSSLIMKVWPSFDRHQFKNSFAALGWAAVFGMPVA